MSVERTADRQKLTLLILVGPKGSGKSHVGTVIERRLGVHFVRVEPIFRAHNNGPGAMKEVQRRIDDAFTEARAVAIESTGAAPEYVQALLDHYECVKLIRVRASAEVCFQRFQDRDNSEHIPVSEDRFHEINEKAVQAAFRWDCELDNDSELTDVDISKAVASLL